MFTIRTGYWRSLWARETCTLLEVRSCTSLETLRGLHSMAYLWLDRRWTHRARLCFPVGDAYDLNENFVLFMEELCNRLGRLGVDEEEEARTGVEDPNTYFTFTEPNYGGSEASTWRLDEEYWANLPLEEARGVQCFLMCGIARALMHRDAIYRLTLDRGHPRCVGRIIIWCQAHMGRSYYKIERYNTRHHRTRTEREIVSTRERPVRDVQIRPYDPRFAPPPPRRGRAQAQAPQQAPPQVPPQVPPQAPTQAPPQAPTQEGQEQEAPTVDVSIGSEIPMTERGGTSAGVRRSARLQQSPPADTKGKGKKSKSYLTCNISPAVSYLRYLKCDTH